MSSYTHSDSHDSDIIIKKKPIKSIKLPIKEALKTVKERAYYADIDKYFTHKCSKKNVNNMIDIINNKYIISLRMLNWFAMKHSATMKAITYVNSDNVVELFDVKISYRARLSTYSKKYFDPFRRNKKFDYNYDKTDSTKLVETTLCQLNFFKWLFVHNLLEYVEQNYESLKEKIGIYNIQEKQNKERKKNVISSNENIKTYVKIPVEEDYNKVVIIL